MSVTPSMLLGAAAPQKRPVAGHGTAEADSVLMREEQSGEGLGLGAAKGGGAATQIVKGGWEHMNPCAVWGGGRGGGGDTGLAGGPGRVQGEVLQAGGRGAPCLATSGCRNGRQACVLQPG